MSRQGAACNSTLGVPHTPGGGVGVLHNAPGNLKHKIRSRKCSHLAAGFSASVKSIITTVSVSIRTVIKEMRILFI